MGGKNPAIVSAKADLDLAAEGVLRSAFGFSGQKCSACSRVYVERSVAEDSSAAWPTGRPSCGSATPWTARPTWAR